MKRRHEETEAERRRVKRRRCSSRRRGNHENSHDGRIIQKPARRKPLRCMGLGKESILKKELKGEKKVAQTSVYGYTTGKKGGINKARSSHRPEELEKRNRSKGQTALDRLGPKKEATCEKPPSMIERSSPWFRKITGSSCVKFTETSPPVRRGYQTLSPKGGRGNLDKGVN